MVQRRKFNAEFKREAVELTRRPQASVSQVAQELGVNANVLGKLSLTPLLVVLYRLKTLVSLHPPDN